jgi:putative restriction endonuclease
MAAAGFELAPFDPLIAFEGSWTIELAERFLPIPNAPPARYECLDGKLIMTPRHGSDYPFATWALGRLLEAASARNGHRFHLAAEVRRGPSSLAEPKLVVSTVSGRGCTWIPVRDVLLVGESVDPTRRSDDRAMRNMCAAAGVPYFLRLEVSYTSDRTEVELLRLKNGAYRQCAYARDGDIFETDLPFPLSFDPDELFILGIGE